MAFDAVLQRGSHQRGSERLSTDLTDTEPDVPWRDVVDMRNSLSHEYFRVRADLVRQTVDEPLAEPGAACERLLDT